MAHPIPDALFELGFGWNYGTLVSDSRHGCTFTTLFDGVRVTTADGVQYDLPRVTSIIIGEKVVYASKVGIDPTN